LSAPRPSPPSILIGMDSAALDLPTLELRLDHALALLRQDRWLLAALRDGKLRVLADSSPELHRPYRRTRPLTHLARRCLHERRPLTVSALAPAPPEMAPAQGAAGPPEPLDWEMEWPALLYTPVGLPGQRPVGLLIAGARTAHWYRQREIDYAAALGVTLTGLVLTLSGPLARLTRRELEAARLIAQGLSLPETSTALRLAPAEARDLVDRVLRKLSVRSPGQLVDRWTRLEPAAGHP
jgi:DNA-binding CsgD family transcriptional regulator